MEAAKSNQSHNPKLTEGRRWMNKP
jgi:hypothetical protein